MIISVLHKLFSLKHFIYNKEIIDIKSINVFNLSYSRHFNDKNNKIRENVIGAIINNKVPEDYFIIQKWLSLKKNVDNYLRNLEDQDQDENNATRHYIKTECIHKAGRKYNYDFNVILYYDDKTIKEYTVEFKFNADSVDDTPQFVSPMKPSQYLTNSYEDYYYDNYLQLLADKVQLQIPSKEIYMKQIHSNKPACMKLLQDIYYRGCNKSSMFSNKKEDIEFYELAKELSKESIRTFIGLTELNCELLTNYLCKTQPNKLYMLYSTKKYPRFVLQKINIDDYIIDNNNIIKNVDKSRYECISKSGKRINILLRWKNGNGIAFPAFQIS